MTPERAEYKNEQQAGSSGEVEELLTVRVYFSDGTVAIFIAHYAEWTRRTVVGLRDFALVNSDGERVAEYRSMFGNHGEAESQVNPAWRKKAADYLTAAVQFVKEDIKLRRALIDDAAKLFWPPPQQLANAFGR